MHGIALERFALVALALVGAGASAQSAAQDLERGEARAMQCVACHGPSGISPNPMFPHLAGQNASYLETQLQNFKSGKRYHELMTPVAETLSPQDISDLAAYFSSIGPLAAAGR